MNQKELLEVLNKERNYEDKIVRDLFSYINHSLKNIPDLTGEEKKRVEVVLSKIAYESGGHSRMFTKLIERCLKDDEIE